MAAINFTNNPVQHDRTKHVEINYHFIREKIDSGDLCLPYVKSSNQVMDVLTKGLSKFEYSQALDKLCMANIYAQIEKECRRKK